MNAARPLPTRSALLAGGLALVAASTTVLAGSPALALVAAHNEQVALVDGSDDQLEFKSKTNGTAQVTSYDGRYVVFSTDAPLVASDDNALDDVYLRDTVDGQHDPGQRRRRQPGNDYSIEPTISDNGRYVAFTTWATNLTPTATAAPSTSSSRTCGPTDPAGLGHLAGGAGAAEQLLARSSPATAGTSPSRPSGRSAARTTTSRRTSTSATSARHHPAGVAPPGRQRRPRLRPQRRHLRQRQSSCSATPTCSGCATWPGGRRCASGRSPTRRRASRSRWAARGGRWSPATVSTSRSRRARPTCPARTARPPTSTGCAGDRRHRAGRP